jgi:hypothetical protein
MTEFFFCIPLKSKRFGDDWERVESLLDRTLRSIFNQTNQDFTVLVACHEVPDSEFSGRENLHFLTLDHPIFRDSEIARADRNLKMRRCAIEIHQRGGGYMLGVDYDDLVSNRIVQYVRENEHPYGYLMPSGYEGEVETKMIWPLPASRRVGPSFDKCCGSCAVLRFSPEDLPSSFDDTTPHVFDSFCSNHQLWEQRSAELGRPLAPLPFPGAIYVVDSGMQMSRLIGDRGPRMRLNQMLGRRRPMTEAQLREFGLAES